MTFHNIFDKNNSDNSAIIKEKILITADYREKNSFVIAELFELNIACDFKQLPIGDFIVKNIVIERKTVSDFLSSMLNRRLLTQLEELQQQENKFLLIEGLEENQLYGETEKEGIAPNAIRGFLLSILLKYKIPIIYTKNARDTAAYLSVLAKKEETSHLSYRQTKRSLNTSEQLQYILEGFPGIGPATAKKLLANFKTLKNIINANAADLEKVIGKKAPVLFNLSNHNF
ncbi:MAG: ERCC4 domain-containing protein [Nanoarchaeota archaeon]